MTSRAEERRRKRNRQAMGGFNPHTKILFEEGRADWEIKHRRILREDREVLAQKKTSRAEDAYYKTRTAMRISAGQRRKKPVTLAGK